MAISARLKAFLESSKISYAVRQHPVVYTAQEIAAAQHVPGRQLAKSVVVMTERGPVLAVLPAIHRVDFAKLKSVLGANRTSIANEAQIKQLFPDIEVGAMSVFGQLYQIPVAVDKALTESSEIVCNAGTHTDTIKLRYADFAAAVKPTVGAFGQSPQAKPAKKRAGKSRPSSKRKTAKKPARAKKAVSKSKRSRGSRRRR